ncbi:hypothetical protein BJX62DRAFT_252674 [Aspergillus germanicus]
MPARVPRSYGLILRHFNSSTSHNTTRSCTSVHNRRATSGVVTFDLDKEAFKAYSAQRWLWNKPAQLQRRYINFNLNTLPGIAKEAAGSYAVCVSLTKLPEGNSNKAFLATMRDGKELIIQIPNPNTGPAHYTTTSEVATMQYRLHIPVPKVLAYYSKASESKLGAEYIMMEKLKPREKLSIIKQVAAITSTYTILFNNRRGDVNVPQGPYALRALARREEAYMENFPTFQRDCQQGIFSRPGSYQPTKEAKLSVLQDFLKIYRHIMPKSKELCAGVILHNNLHTDNIFVDTQNLFLIIHHPSLIEYTGPKLAGFIKPTLPKNLNSLNPEAKKATKDLFISQALWLSYRIEVQRAAPKLGPHVQNLLSNISEDGIWKQVVGVDKNGDASMPCPLKNSEQERSWQKEEYAKWERDIKRKGRVLDEIGLYAGWNGAVSPQDYDEVVRRLAAAKDHFLTQESANEQERAF